MTNFPKVAGSTRLVGVTPALLLGALICASSSALAAPVTPKSATAFIDSIGVNTHVTAGGVYGSTSNTQAKLVDLGIKHVRDSVNVNNPAASDGLKTFYTNAGIKTTLTVDWGPNPLANWGSQNPLLESLNIARDRIGVSAISQITGPNEPNLKQGYGGSTQWANDTATFMKNLWNATRSNSNYSAFSGISIVGPAIAGGGNEPERDMPLLKTAFGSDNIENYVSYAGIHPYPAAGWPADVGDTIGTQIPRIRNLYPTKTFVATETGYHNALGAGGAANETAAGVYAPRLFLDYFGYRGIRRTFWYELFNEDFNGNGISDSGNNEENYGLFRLDGSRKPAGTAIKNLVSLLNDTGTPTLSALDVTLSNSNARSLLLRKSNGDYFLALWIADYNTSWQNASNPATFPSEQACTLTLTSSRTLTAYTNLDTTLATTSLGSGTTFNLSIGARVKIFKIASGSNPIPIGQRIAFKANINGRFALANLNDATNVPIIATSTAVGAWEKFDLVDAGGGAVALKSVANGKYVSCDLTSGAGRALKAPWATSIGTWEKFTWFDRGGGQFALKSNASNFYVSCHLSRANALVADFATGVGDWEKFTWQSAP